MFAWFLVRNINGADNWGAGVCGSLKRDDFVRMVSSRCISFRSDFKTLNTISYSSSSSSVSIER